jgi:hypothetical protein
MNTPTFRMVRDCPGSLPDPGRLAVCLTFLHLPADTQQPPVHWLVVKGVIAGQNALPPSGAVVSHLAFTGGHRGSGSGAGDGAGSSGPPVGAGDSGSGVGSGVGSGDGRGTGAGLGAGGSGLRGRVAGQLRLNMLG